VHNYTDSSEAHMRANKSVSQSDLDVNSFSSEEVAWAYAGNIKTADECSIAEQTNDQKLHICNITRSRYDKDVAIQLDSGRVKLPTKHVSICPNQTDQQQ